MEGTAKIVLPARVEELDDGRYFAICDLIQGCHAEGDTVDEALDILQDVARIMLEVRREDGAPVDKMLEGVEPGTPIEVRLADGPGRG